MSIGRFHLCIGASPNHKFRDGVSMNTENKKIAMSSLIIKLWHTNFVCDGCFYTENGFTQIDYSTIDGDVEYANFLYSCILTSQVSTQFLCPTKLLVIGIILE